MAKDADGHEGGRFEFHASRGGPFYDLQLRLKLLRAENLHVIRRAVLFVALAWGVPCLMTLAISAVSGRQDAYSYLTDLSVWAKYVVAIGAFILVEKQVDRGLRFKLLQLIRAQIVPPSTFPALVKVVAAALRKRNSVIAELICLVLAYSLSAFSFVKLHGATTSSWMVQANVDGNQITGAGWWQLLVSLPLFSFLFSRILWRHYVWSWLLHRIARLDLRLVAAHPDRMAGLSFLSAYPTAYILFVFGASAALAAALVKNMHLEELTPATFTVIMVGWLAAVLSMFAYPLSAFSKPLAALKEATLILAASEATAFWRQSERRALGRNIAANDQQEAQTVDSATDPTVHFEGANKLSVMLVKKAALIPISAAALVPVALIGAANLPLKQVFELLKKLVLL